MKKNLFRAGGLLVLVGLASCSDVSTTSSTLAPTSVARSVATTTIAIDENVQVSEFLDQVNVGLAAENSDIRLAEAELLLDGNGAEEVSATRIIANNRVRGLSHEWVAGDPRRAGRIGISYAIKSTPDTLPRRFNVGGPVTTVPFTQVVNQIEEGMSAWRGVSCSSAPVTQVAVAPGTDPDQLDEYFTFKPRRANYRQPADIVQAGWRNPSFFTTLGGPTGGSIIGVAFSFYFVDAAGQPTDIDNNGKADKALAEIFYNRGFGWADGTGGNVDFYSIITHETGHGLGLAHFGKVFVTKKDRFDGGGTSIDEIKYAPKAMMNAVYVTGRNELAGTDNSSFCQIWASAK